MLKMFIKNQILVSRTKLVWQYPKMNLTAAEIENVTFGCLKVIFAPQPEGSFLTRKI